MPSDPEAALWVSGAAEVKGREDDHQEAKGEGEGGDFALVVISPVRRIGSPLDCDSVGPSEVG